MGACLSQMKRSLFFVVVVVVYFGIIFRILGIVFPIGVRPMSYVISLGASCGPRPVVSQNVMKHLDKSTHIM